MPAVTAAGSEVARLRLVSAAIDGRSHFLVIRFDREGEERFARWIGGQEWRERSALHQLFAEAEPVASETIAGAQTPEAVEAPPLATAAEPNDTAIPSVGGRSPTAPGAR